MLQVLSKLPQLSQVDLSYQYVYGALPANISFARLEVLTLVTTYLTVGIGSPSFYMATIPDASRVAERCHQQCKLALTPHCGWPYCTIDPHEDELADIALMTDLRL